MTNQLNNLYNSVNSNENNNGNLNNIINSINDVKLNQLNKIEELVYDNKKLVNLCHEQEHNLSILDDNILNLDQKLTHILLLFYF